VEFANYNEVEPAKIMFGTRLNSLDLKQLEIDDPN
jgi:hypothetical protein